MPKKVLIEVQKELFLKCDNNSCKFQFEMDHDLEISHKMFIDMPCPECNENLLTQEDNDRHLRMIRTIKWINKWFGWLGSYPNDDEGIMIRVDTHKKITLTQEND